MSKRLKLFKNSISKRLKLLLFKTALKNIVKPVTTWVSCIRALFHSEEKMVCCYYSKGSIESPSVYIMYKYQLVLALVFYFQSNMVRWNFYLVFPQKSENLRENKQ